MITYYIQTPGGKEGPFSIEELRKKGVNPETLLRTEGGRWIPACKIEELKSLLNETGVPLHFKKHVGPKYVFSADAISEPKTRKRITFMQCAAVVLLILNGALYYYKQDGKMVVHKQQSSEPAPAPVKLASAPVKKIVQQAAESPASKVDTANTHIRNRWSEFIKVSHNAFRYYSKFGGIRHLQAIVKNQTGFPLDTVKVSVRYIKRGQTFKTEYVTLYNIPEHGELAVPAPNSKSGTSVILDITQITAEKLKFHYSADLPAEGADPYLKM
ncbi:DUF4339 domain-containing protein [Flavihumibacter sp. R14]|nr:DUF4339 domain-containing protein [Flavihumibacter soli]